MYVFSPEKAVLRQNSTEPGSNADGGLNMSKVGGDVIQVLSVDGWSFDNCCRYEC